MCEEFIMYIRNSFACMYVGRKVNNLCINRLRLESAKIFSSAGIPIRVVLDSAVGALMEQVDLCLVGAEGVMENGGIANKVRSAKVAVISTTFFFVIVLIQGMLSLFQIGTYQVALVAKALQKPFYVAAESYKFARMYPLSQRDAITAAAAATSTAVSVAKVGSIVPL